MAKTLTFTQAGPLPRLLLAPTDVVDSDTTICLCGGLLAYVRGAFRHIDRCIECVGTVARCPERHYGCDDAAPEPVMCIHDADWGCSQPVNLLNRCAYARGPRSCCSCCWVASAGAEASA